MRNARFWTYVNGGPVRITLRPGETRTHYQGEPTDEGWTSETTTYELEDGIVRREWCVDGRDCDGRLTRYGVEVCPIDRLASGNEPYIDGDDPETWAGVVWPDWQSESSYQRDYEAEKAGY